MFVFQRKYVPVLICLTAGRLHCLTAVVVFNLSSQTVSLIIFFFGIYGSIAAFSYVRNTRLAT